MLTQMGPWRVGRGSRTGVWRVGVSSRGTLTFSNYNVQGRQRLAQTNMIHVSDEKKLIAIILRS